MSSIDSHKKIFPSPFSQSEILHHAPSQSTCPNKKPCSYNTKELTRTNLNYLIAPTKRDLPRKEKTITAFQHTKKNQN